MKKMLAIFATLALALTLTVPTFASAKSAQETQTAPAAQTKAPVTKSSKKPPKKHRTKHAKKASSTKTAQSTTTAPMAAPKQ